MPAAARWWGLAAALSGLVLDQAHKAWMLGPFAIGDRGRVPVTPFLDLVMVWNRGVSYGLFTQDSEAGRWFLVVLGLAGTALFSWWMWRSQRLLPALSLGLIAGGALANVIDRIIFGAVADFFLFHAGTFEWYVFNLADVWIVAGVIGMALAWLTESATGDESGEKRPENATD
ncbi:MAG TPA: signal peptidase II [Afifellaceae bacterium]|nr:signal peptidase II [Afifellaceae bacterium]